MKFYIREGKMRVITKTVLCCILLGISPLLVAQEIPAVAGWQIALPTPGTHSACVDMSTPRTGKGCGKIVGITNEKNARACFMQDFRKKNAVKAGRTYRYAISYRTIPQMEGHGELLIDCYTAVGEKSHKALVSAKLAASPEWKTLSGEVSVPEKVVHVRILLYLHGKGTVWFDDVFFGDVADAAPNLLKNGGLEPPGSYVFDLAPEKGAGKVKLSAEFENGTLGKVKEIGPDEFYVYAFAQDKPRSPFLWFHFRVDGCEGCEVTFHVNPTPFSKDNTGGNGTRSPVMSYDGDCWSGIENKQWNEDGTVLTFKQRFSKSHVWVASFYPFTAEHISRFIARYQGNPLFSSRSLGKTKQGRDLQLYAITDPAVSEGDKRVIIFTTLQHPLETTGAMAQEGICRFLLSDDPRAAKMRRAFVFYIVPQMDPDGIATGNMYCPVGNLNRQWGIGTTPETTAVEQFARELNARGRKIDLFMDFHGWCTPERTTVFMTYGKEITSEEIEHDAVRLVEAIKPKLSGKVSTHIWRKRVETVTGITSDVSRLAPGWMKFEAGARLAYSIEIFGEGECTQEQYFAWGKAFAEGIAGFYGF
ncbi:MAG: M14-type cytosolic carboxypeptidase [Kiritimatiellae bacterium]|nr:M14-type cytosolic carboxypeptidase [Kiritimatiellia bacterium]MDD5520993.1 M14-type cytosolic carboxypeptidase [Kiritimatiellia bacterium]